VGIIFTKNNYGKALIKISADSGATWSTGCSGTGSATCTQIVAKAGTKGLVYSTTTTGCPSYSASDPEKNGACAAGQDVAAALPGASDAQTVFGFGWINDDRVPVANGGYTNSFDSTVYQPGLYTKTWSNAGGWGPTVRVSCVMATGTCSSAPAVAAYEPGQYGPSLSAYGTPGGTYGFALAWTGCRYTTRLHPTMGCDETAKDPGAEVLYKESGNNGLSWGGDFGVASSYNRVVQDTTGGNGGTLYRINEYPTVVVDKPGAAYLGCHITPAT
jgi:hypothetical protein